MTTEKKKTIDLRAFLATFAPEYPMKKGYVAALILEQQKTVLRRVQKKMTAIVQPLVTDKFIWDKSLEANLFQFNEIFRKLLHSLNNKWPNLVELCNEIFPIKFKELPTVVLLQPPQPSAIPSSSQQSALPSQPSTLPSPQSSVLDLPSQLPASDAPSTSYINNRSTRQRLRNDCEQCADKQQQFKKVNAHLLKKMKEQKERHTLEIAKYSSICGADEVIKKKEKSILQWKAKYSDLLVTSTYDASKARCLRTSLDVLKKENSDLSEKLKDRDNTIQETVVGNQNLKQHNLMLFREVKKLKKDIAILSKTNEKLKKDQEKNPGEYLQSVSSTSAAENTSTAQSVLKDEQVPNIFSVCLTPPPHSHHLKPQDLASLDANEDNFN